MIATPAEIRLADLVHARAAQIPDGPGLRHEGRWIYASALWDAVAADRDGLLWHAFANPAHWGLDDRDDGGYALRAWLAQAARLCDEAGIPLVVLANGTGYPDLDPVAAQRSRIITMMGPEGAMGHPPYSAAVAHFLVDRSRYADAYTYARRVPTRARSVFTPPALRRDTQRER
jgi:hypothetical protein